MNILSPYRTQVKFNEEENHLDPADWFSHFKRNYSIQRSSPKDHSLTNYYESKLYTECLLPDVHQLSIFCYLSPKLLQTHLFCSLPNNLFHTGQTQATGPESGTIGNRLMCKII